MARKAPQPLATPDTGAHRPGAQLPALSDVDVERIQKETEEGVSRLLGANLSRHTARSYRSGLRYWDAWHWSAYGSGLPLLATPRKAVKGAVVRAFVAHHTAVPGPKGLVLGMPAPVRARMEAIGAFGRRQVASRPEAEPGTDEAIPAVGTVLQRVALLNAVHTMVKLTPPQETDRGLARVLRGLKKASAEVAPVTGRRAKTSISPQQLDVVLADCARDGIVGRRDAALLRVGYTGRRRGELASMRIEHLEACPLADPEGGTQDGWIWGVRKAKGKVAETADGIVDEVPIAGHTARLLEDWLDTLQHYTEQTTGPVWRRIAVDQRGAVTIGPAMDEEDIADVVKRRMAALGFDPDSYAGHSLRSGAARSASSISDARAMLNHASESTTRQFYADKRAERVAAALRHERKLKK